MTDELPTGQSPVCPRCGTETSDGVWCQGCGLNLRQQGELPSADAYAAKIREQRWLEERKRQEEEQRRAEAEHRQGEARREKARRDERAAEGGAARRQKAEARAEEKATQRPRRKRRAAIAATIIAVFLLAGSALAYALTDGFEGEAEPVAQTDPTPETDVETEPGPQEAAGLEQCQTLQLGESERGQEYLSIRARGISCEEAEQLGEEMASSQGGPPAGYTCTGNTALKCVQGEKVILFGFGANPTGEEPLSEESPLSTEGLGPVLAGMSLDEAEEAAQTSLVSLGPSLPGKNCQLFESPALNGVQFMVVDGLIARVDVLERGVATLSGIEVGDTKAAVLEEYGDQLEFSAAQTNPDYELLTFIPSDASDDTRLIFLSDTDQVTAMHAGRLPEVEYEEGCLTAPG